MIKMFQTRNEKVLVSSKTRKVKNNLSFLILLAVQAKIESIFSP